jgi:hypothetical protein
MQDIMEHFIKQLVFTFIFFAIEHARHNGAFHKAAHYYFYFLFIKGNGNLLLWKKM